MCRLIITPCHLVHPLPSLAHDGISCLCTYNWQSLFSIFLIKMHISLCLHFTFFVLFRTAFALPLFWFFILIAQFLHTDFLTFSLTFLGRRATTVITIGFGQLWSNPRVKRSQLSTGPLEEPKSYNVLQLRWLWGSCSGYTPSLLPLMSNFTGILLGWQEPSLRLISGYVLSISSSWCYGSLFAFIEMVYTHCRSVYMSGQNMWMFWNTSQ